MTCPLNYTCFKCKQVGKHWIMQCPKNQNHENVSSANLSYNTSTVTNETSQFRFSKLSQHQQPTTDGISGFNWKSIHFTGGKPQQAYLSPDEKYITLKIKNSESYMYAEYFTVYDLTKGKIYCSFKSKNFQISKHYWISPEFMFCQFYGKNDQSGLCVLDIKRSTLWILETNLKENQFIQLFHVSNDTFISIDNNQICYYKTTANQYKVSIDCGVDKLKCIGIKSFKKHAFSFLKNAVHDTDNDDVSEPQQSERIGECMKLNTISMLVIPRHICETQTITKQCTPFDYKQYGFSEDEYQDSEPEYNEEEVECLMTEIYLLDLQTDKILKTNVEINDKKSIHIFYSKTNPQWQWCDNNKFFMVTIDHHKHFESFEYNIILNKYNNSEPFQIHSKLLKCIGDNYDIVDGNCYAKDQVVQLHNVLVKGTSKEECTYESMAIGYDPFDKDEYESTYYHVLYPLDPNMSSEKCIKYEIDYIHQAFIDQLSGLILVQSKYKYLDKNGYYNTYGEWTHPHKLGFAVINPLKGDKIGFISYPENTYTNGTIFANFGATKLLLSGYGTNKIYYCSLRSKHQLQSILKYISVHNRDGFGLLLEPLICLILDFIYG
eukprot:131709_1